MANILGYSLSVSIPLFSRIVVGRSFSFSLAAVFWLKTVMALQFSLIQLCPPTITEPQSTGTKSMQLMSYDDPQIVILFIRVISDHGQDPLLFLPCAIACCLACFKALIFIRENFTFDVETFGAFPFLKANIDCVCICTCWKINTN